MGVLSTVQGGHRSLLQELSGLTCPISASQTNLVGKQELVSTDVLSHKYFALSNPPRSSSVPAFLRVI